MKFSKISVAGLSFCVLNASAEISFDRPAKEITRSCAAYIETFDKNIAALVGQKSEATYDTVFESFDNYITEFADSLLHDNLMQNTHPNEAIRKASTDCTLKGFEELSALNANRALYDRMSQVGLKDLPEEKAFTVNYWKQRFQKSGIGKDQTTREKIKALNDEISQIGTEFNQNITDAVGSIQVKQERLAGMPDDYLTAHPANSEGLVAITTAYSDISPVIKYAHDRELRKQLALMSMSRAGKENPTVLLNLLAKRYELAKILGHNNFAELNLLGTMAKTSENVVQFTAKLNDAIKQPSKKEKARLLKQIQAINADAKQVKSWDVSYLSNLVREKEYQMDAKLVREYFDYDKVRDGIIGLSEDLFEISIRESDGPVWHDSVEAYEVFESDQLIGRFYFDSHPREGKYTHAEQFGLKLGKKGISKPSAALVMNFPKGLMEHGQVETFLHEFGHLIHFIFSGQNDIGHSAFQEESDFGEAPSIMLEEWVWNYDTLSNFATNSKGELIPKNLVKKMNSARYFGQALEVARQLAYTAFAFDLYNQNPKGLDLDAFEKKVFERYSPYGYIEGTHDYASFGHLYGYGAKYYTYQWSDSIAEELLSRFKKEGLRNTNTARDYREMILAKTGTKPAAELVNDFLERNFTVNAFVESLSRGE